MSKSTHAPRVCFPFMLRRSKSQSYSLGLSPGHFVFTKGRKLIGVGIQEERLRRLKNRTKVYFDSTRLEHQEALRVLWSSTFPNEELDDLISDQWKKMGWQGKDPSTDFRGAGFISLENLLFFAKTFSLSFQCLIQKQGSMGAAWEYPFAVAGVNITFMLIKMLDLDATKPRTLVSAVFIHMLSENEWAFDLLYCVAFIIMDKIWGEKNASYMEFNDVLESTRAQLKEELLLDDVLRIEDMPSFRLLY
uniref:ELMO domain-containing protein A isoform X2 n=1 Tax=Erigeron canadensis TaxID=72917 RepID=UPI001CB99199|nr:ELMO domain-containing protein A isoform X2 [Erigeron canadensis]XP_043611935.1 ELMO domain-containing protein A isoform X2 [Erigeron canadensis]